LTAPTASPAGRPPAQRPVSRPVPSASGLGELGWDEHFESLFQAELRRLAPSVRERASAGRVLRRDRTVCSVGTSDGVRQLAIAQHLLASSLEAPTTGDFVVVSGDDIVAVLARRTAIRRAAFRDLSAQVLAANVDTVLAVSSLANPWRARRVERLLVIAWQTGAVPIVVLSKADCCEEAGEAYAAAVAIAPGCAVHVVSALTGEGMDGLGAQLGPRTTSVMIGTSGAGKSTLANALSNGEAALATAEIRGDGKGRHTTVTRELVQLANGALMIDTPGLRAIGLWEAEEALADAFSDVEELALGCRFNDCAHDSEPGCSVKEAIAEGRLSRGRLDSYRRLQREQERLAARTDDRLRAERSAAFKATVKQRRSQFYR